MADLPIEPGEGRTILLVVAHADDPALFLGGTILRWTDAGWRVVCVRATDDARDSVELSETETIAANAREFGEVAAALGIAETIELGYPTDTLGDASETALRERIIFQIRRHKPYALVAFDPFSRPHEDNQDHLKLAAACDEAFWTSQFDKHHPEHFAEDLKPHGCFERWYFGRDVAEITGAVDIAPVLERKIGAAMRHRTMLRHLAHQLRLQAQTGGWHLSLLDDVIGGGDPTALFAPLLRAQAARIGARHGLEAAEEFRMVRFGGLEPLLHRHGRRIAPINDGGDQ